MSHKKALNRELNSYLSQRRNKKDLVRSAPWFGIFQKRKEEPEEIPLHEIKRTLEKSGVDTSYMDSLEKNKVKRMEEATLVKEESKLNANVQPTVSAAPQTESKKEESKDKVTEEENEYEDEVSTVENEEKESFFQKLGKMFSFGRKQDLKAEYENADEQIENASAEGLGATEIVVNDEALRDDLKKSMKIAFDVMQRLPQAQFDRYKESDNFKEYKKLLEKHKIKQL
jgi:hypothetical protein